jgi:protein tyrosine phosphatase (PTP) superfamily phosphohydrolase (DUF442 family)
MGSRLRTFSLIALLTILCAGGITQEASDSAKPDPQHPFARRLTAKGVGNFAEVTPKLYRGAQPEAQGLESLRNMGINTIIDVRLTGAGKEGAAAKKLGMDFVALPWHCLFPKDDPFAKFLAYLREHPDKKVFVHCRYGDDRTGMMIAAYRMAVEGWSAEDARKEMNAFGFHKVICASLAGYEKSFPERLKKDRQFQELKSNSNGRR